MQINQPIEIEFDKELFHEHQVLLINTHIEKIPVKLIVDTGSSYNILTEEFFVKAQIDKPIVGKVSLQSLSGKQVSYLVNVELDLCEHFSSEIKVCVTKTSFDQEYGITGQLGLRTLIDYNAIIDVPNFKLILNP